MKTPTWQYFSLDEYRGRMDALRRRMEAKGVDIMLVADTSGSMEAMDFTLGGKRATRLDVAKKWSTPRRRK